MTNTQKLLRDIETKRLNWNERSQFELKGIGNLSPSDLDVIELYVSCYERQGNFYGLMEPRGYVKDVLTAYDIKDPQEENIYK